MAYDNEISSAVDPSVILLKDEAEQGLVPNPGGFGGGLRKRSRNRFRGEAGRDRLTIAEMKARMTAHWKEGTTYVEIAEMMNEEYGLSGDKAITHNNIEYHIKQALKAAREQSNLHINERQALVLARYDQLEMLCTEAYFASMQGKVTRNYERMVKNAKSKDREKEMQKSLKRAQRRVDKENAVRKKRGEPLLPDPTPDHIFGELPDTLVLMAENIKEYEREEENHSGDPRWVTLLIDINDKRAKLWNLLNRQDISNPDQQLAQLPDAERTQRLTAVLHAAMARRTGDTGRLAPATPLGGFKDGEEPDEMKIKFAQPEEIEEIAFVEEWDFDE